MYVCLLEKACAWVWMGVSLQSTEQQDMCSGTLHRCTVPFIWFARSYTLWHLQEDFEMFSFFIFALWFFWTVFSRSFGTFFHAIFSSELDREGRRSWTECCALFLSLFHLLTYTHSSPSLSLSLSSILSLPSRQNRLFTSQPARLWKENFLNSVRGKPKRLENLGIPFTTYCFCIFKRREQAEEAKERHYN